MVSEHRRLLQMSPAKNDLDYNPPARDAITLPRNVVFILIGVVLVLVATYAIVGHLIKDLMHDLADWILGPKPVEDHYELDRTTIEEKVRLSGHQMARDEVKMEGEKEGTLPGSKLPSEKKRPPFIERKKEPQMD